MKTILKTILLVLGLTSPMVSADFLGEADDSYIGYQITSSLDLTSARLFSGRYQQHYILIRQKDGIKDGIAFSEDSNGGQVLNYLRPSTTFDVGTREISEYAVPIVRLDAGADSDTGRSSNSALLGLGALVVVGAILKRDLEKPWRPASPD